MLVELRNRARLLNRRKPRFILARLAMSSSTTADKKDPMPVTVGAVIVAAGRGARAGLQSGPKQYYPLAGKALIAHTLDALARAVPETRICIVIHRDDDDLIAQAIGAKRTRSVIVAHGDKTRQGSVRCGLEALAAEVPEITHVMIHDAARPFVGSALLERINAACVDRPNVGILPVLAIAETIKRIEVDQVVSTVPRQGLHTAQTPQTFPLAMILDVHRRAAAEARDDFTDDAALFEWAGMTVIAIDGDPGNQKLTYGRDFEMAEQKMMQQMLPLPDIRTGNGYDVHRFGAGDHVMLCGVSIPHERKLSGHSDADVGLHALTDALLATCGAGDIGDHFPPSDPKWKGQASSLFVEHAAKIVHDAGGTIMNADVSIVAEAPKIAPHRDAMRSSLAQLLGIDLRRCSVKATTNEKMGFIGRSEGIAALATATVAFRSNDDDG